MSAPVWRPATTEESADYHAGWGPYNDDSAWMETRETSEGLEVLDGPSLDCGCIPHVTTMRGMWGFYCETEEQGYCNFECPHEDDDED